MLNKNIATRLIQTQSPTQTEWDFGWKSGKWAEGRPYECLT